MHMQALTDGLSIQAPAIFMHVTIDTRYKVIYDVTQSTRSELVM